MPTPSRGHGSREIIRPRQAATGTKGANGMPEERSTTARRSVKIVDLGRGPQIEGHRLTVMDVF
jgi:hypothetical protein